MRVAALAFCLLASLATAFGARHLLQGAPAQSVAPASSSSSNLHLLSATQAVSLLCSRQITAVDYVNALDSYYQSSGYSCTNPWITYNITKVLADAAAIDAKAASGQSILPLCGLPLAVKDSIDVLGYPTTCATPGLAGHYPPFSAPLVDQYLAANGIIMGKANLAEYQGSPTNPTGNGITSALNPYDPTRTTGGSSTGNGPILAAGLAPLALCEDTGGSCRYPAVSSGLYGFRPTLGCYNYSDGLVPYLFDRDTVGSMARTAEDLVLLDSIVRNSPANTTSVGALDSPVQCAVNVNTNLSLQGVRIGIPSSFGWVTPGISAEVSEVMNNALNKIRAAGAILVPFDSSAFGTVSSKAWQGGGSPNNYIVPETLARYLWTHNYTDTVWDIYNKMNRPDLKRNSINYLKTYLSSVLGSRENYVNFLRFGRPNITAVWQQTMVNNNITALLYPAQVTEVAPIDRGDQYVLLRNASRTFVIPRSQGVNAALDAGADATVGTFPIGFGTTETPVGLMVGGPPGSDSTVLSLLIQMNKLFGDFPRPPAQALCTGCVANVTNVQMTFNATTATLASTLPSDMTYTPFGLVFSAAPGNTCNATYLTYGQTGPVARGPPQNLSIPIVPVQGVALPPVASAG